MGMKVMNPIPLKGQKKPTNSKELQSFGFRKANLS